MQHTYLPTSESQLTIEKSMDTSNVWFGEPMNFMGVIFRNMGDEWCTGLEMTGICLTSWILVLVKVLSPQSLYSHSTLVTLIAFHIRNAPSLSASLPLSLPVSLSLHLLSCYLQLPFLLLFHSKLTFLMSWLYWEWSPPQLPCCLEYDVFSDTSQSPGLRSH